MKTFWKTHPALRIVLMIVLFVLSIALVVAGWKMTGQLAGLGIMLVGVALLQDRARYHSDRPGCGARNVGDSEKVGCGCHP